MSFWRKSLFYTALMILQAAAQRVGGLIAHGLLARMLTPVDWGSLQAITTVSTTISQTLKLSVDSALQVRIAETGPMRAGDHPREQILGAGIVLVPALSALALLFGAGFAPQAAALFGDPALAHFMGVAGALAALQLGSQLVGVCAALGNFRATARVAVYSAIANVVLVAVPYALGIGSIWVAIGATLAAQAIVTLGGGLMVARTLREHGLAPRFDRLWSAGRELVRLGLPLHLASAVPAAVSLFLSSKVARASGMESLADLRVVAVVNQLVAFVPGALANTFMTQFARLRGADSQIPTEHFLRYLRVIIASSLLTALATATLKPYLVRAVFGSQYLPTVGLVDLGLISVTVMMVRQGMVVGLISERRTGFALLDALLTYTSSAVIGQLLIPQLRAAGYLLAEAAGNLLCLCVLLAVFGQRLRGERRGLELSGALGTLAFGLAALGVSYATRGDAPRVLPLAAALTAIVLAAPFTLFTREERERARLELKRLSSKRRSAGG